MVSCLRKHFVQYAAYPRFCCVQICFAVVCNVCIQIIHLLVGGVKSSAVVVQELKSIDIQSVRACGVVWFGKYQWIADWFIVFSIIFSIFLSFTKILERPFE